MIIFKYAERLKDRRDSSEEKISTKINTRVRKEKKRSELEKNGFYF